jgi:heme exporter protein CcmD
MSHTPFIVAAYGVALVLLAWCALAPILRGRKMKRFILSRSNHTEDNHAPDA